jgi:hypothetical protein
VADTLSADPDQPSVEEGLRMKEFDDDEASKEFRIIWKQLVRRIGAQR